MNESQLYEQLGKVYFAFVVRGLELEKAQAEVKRVTTEANRLAAEQAKAIADLQARVGELTTDAEPDETA